MIKELLHSEVKQDNRIKPTPENLEWLETAHPIDIINSPFLYSRVETFPLFALIPIDVEIDSANKKKLKSSIEYRGQGQPTGVRPVPVSHEEWRKIWESQTKETREQFSDFADHCIFYEIFDGFHRVDILNEQPDINQVTASVWYNMTDEEFNAERIKASLKHSVKFSRLAHWIKDAFALSPWCESGIRIDQIFALASNDSSGIQFMNKFGFTENDIEAMKSWAIQKSKEWEKPNVDSMLPDLRIVVNIDPQLIKQIRLGGGRLRPGIMLKIAEVLHHDTDPYYTAQNLLAPIIKNHNLLQREIRLIAQLILIYQNNPKILNMLIADPRNTAEGINMSQEDIDEAIDLLTQGRSPVLKKGDPQPTVFQKDRGSIQQNQGKSLFKSPESGGQSYNTKLTPREIARQNLMLKKQVQQLSQKTSSGELSMLAAPNLSPEEIHIIHLHYSKHLPLEQIARQLNKTPNQISRLLKSASTKYNLRLSEQYLEQNIRSLNPRSSEKFD